MADYFQYLEECVKATEGCVQASQKVVSQLYPGTRDLPRLSKILRNQHHFLLLPAPLLSEYKSELSDSLGPQIETLIARAEIVLGREKEKGNGLQERLSLLKSAHPDSSLSSSSRPTATTARQSSNSAPPVPKDLSLAQKKKMMLLKAKRERLTKELARMES